MKLRNIKGHFILNNEIFYDSEDSKYIFPGCNAKFTVYIHHKNVIHVTGVKSKTHLNQCGEYLKKTFNNL